MVTATLQTPATIPGIYNDTYNSVNPILDDIFDDIGIPEFAGKRCVIACHLMRLIKDCEGSISHNCLSCMASTYFQAMCDNAERGS